MPTSDHTASQGMHYNKFPEVDPGTGKERIDTPISFCTYCKMRIHIPNNFKNSPKETLASNQNISTAQVVAEQWKNVGTQWHEEEQDRSDKFMVFMRNEKCK